MQRKQRAGEKDTTPALSAIWRVPAGPKRFGLWPATWVVTVLTVIACGSGSFTAAQPSTSATVQQASPTPSPQFIPSPAVRDAHWPAGSPLPADLAGAWMVQHETDPMHMGGYTWEIASLSGNVEVSGSEIDFISELCGAADTFGYDRYHYTLTGSTMVLNRIGTWNCGWRFEGTWTKVAAVA